MMGIKSLPKDMAAEEQELINERRLIAAVLAGERAATDYFVERYKKFVYSILVRTMRLPRDQADDVFQQVFYNLWEQDYRRLRSWRGEGRFTSFLALIVRRLALDHLRSLRGNLGSEDPPDGPDPAPGPEGLRYTNELREVLQAALKQLATRDRELIERHHILGQSYHEIAQALELTVNNVGVALCRAEKRLRDTLGGKWKDILGAGSNEVNDV